MKTNELIDFLIKNNFRKTFSNNKISNFKKENTKCSITPKRFSLDIDNESFHYFISDLYIDDKGNLLSSNSSDFGIIL